MQHVFDGLKFHSPSRKQHGNALRGKSADKEMNRLYLGMTEACGKFKGILYCFARGLIEKRSDTDKRFSFWLLHRACGMGIVLMWECGVYLLARNKTIKKETTDETRKGQKKSYTGRFKKMTRVRLKKGARNPCMDQD